MAGASNFIVRGGADFSEIEKKFQGLEKKMGKVADKLKKAGSTLTKAVTLPIAGIGVASFKFAADLQDAMGASDQIFKGASVEVKKWADNLESYYGIAEGEALSYANTMGAMLQNIGGLTEEEAAKQSQTLVQLAGDLSAMFGGTTESAVQALTGALKGNNSMLDNYGMGVNDATVKAKAFEMGLYSGKGEMSLATKQAATLALVMEQTADAQGQAAREAEGASGSMKMFTTEIKNLGTDIGGVLLPIITPLITKIGEIVQKFGEMSPETQKTIVVIAGVAAAIGPLLLVLGSLASGISSIIAIAPVLGTAFTLLTGPVGLVIAAIAGAIAIGVALYKNWDTIKAKAAELGDRVGNAFNVIKERISTNINAAKETVKTAIDKIKGFFDFKWELPKLKLPHFSITGKFSLNPPQIPSFGVDWYDKGGIFNQPAIIGVGEKRPEFVGALEDLRYLIRDELTRDKGGEIKHSGTIRVEGVTNSGELMGVVDVVMEQLRRENRR